jgi:hypothetical protein
MFGGLAFQLRGLKFWARLFYGAGVGLFLTVRSIIWLLMNWK